MKAFLPLLLYALNFYIGAQVVSGRVQPSCQGDVMNSFIDVGGYALIFGTGIFSAIHAFKIAHATTTNKPVVTPQATPATPPANVSQSNFSQTSPLPPGTPLS